jgi:ArsR family transcriptional regulator
MVAAQIPQAGCAARLAAVADPTRLSVLRVLLRGPRHVNEINADLGLPLNLLSHHLRILREAGLVEAQRDGKAVTYTVEASVKASNLAREAIDLGCCCLTFRQDGRQEPRSKSAGRRLTSSPLNPQPRSPSRPRRRGSR